MFLFSLGLFAQKKVVHVIVSLCDNVNQGIVPVPKKIGNGQDPANNLYWGCGFGVKTYITKQPDWKLLTIQKNPSKLILERLIFKHKNSSIYLVADAYDGAQIKQATIDFLNYAAGLSEIQATADSVQIVCGGRSNLICYIGHNGLMDFKLDDYPARANLNKREVIILACASKLFFANYIKKCGAYPLLWTTNLMCPEAYTLDTAIDCWIKNEDPSIIREKAAQTYNQFQKCGINGAKRLLVTGF